MQYHAIYNKAFNQLKANTYKAKLVLRKYIPKTDGKLRPLGIPAIADKLLQRGVAKILEAIYEQDFLTCSYGYRPGIGALKAVKDLSRFEDTVRKHCRGQIYLCRYADDFVCAFEDANDAERFYKALSQRLEKFGLQVAEDKTRTLAFSHCKVRVKTKFDFLGFEFRWSVNRWGKTQLKRRTSRDKLRASLAKFKEWFKKNVRLPKKILFAKLNRKLQGHYNYYGVRGNYKSLSHFVFWVRQLCYKWLNRCSQRKSYNVEGFKALVNDFGIANPRICHDF